MNASMILKLAASGLALSLVTTGCTTGTARVAGASQALPEKPSQAASAAAKAREFLAKDKVAKAVDQAELAVSYASRDAGYRTLLGQSYLAAGRFKSAISAFDDAKTLGANDAQTIIGLALSQIAAGKEADAVKLIMASNTVVPAADAGLALALAGDFDRAVYILTEAARQPEADARTRQNLAFALAMSGRWAQARIVAAQDLSLAKIDGRMAEWSKLAQAGDSSMRVAGLIGVTPVNDVGMPVRLALAPVESPVELVAVAAADPAPIADFAPPPPAAAAVEVAVAAPVEPAPAIRAVELPMPTTAAKAAEAEVILADKTPYRAPPRVAGGTELAAAAKPAAKPVAKPTERPAAAEARTLAARVTLPRARSFDAKKPSGWAVQLGAYDTLGVAKHKWVMLTRNMAILKDFPASSQSATVRGRSFYRLTVNGLATQREAMQLCSALKARGQGCFVRAMDATEKVEWASKASVRLASR